MILSFRFFAIYPQINVIIDFLPADSWEQGWKVERNFENFGRLDLQVVGIMDQYWDCDQCLMRIDVLLNQSEERISYYRIELNRHTHFLLSAQFDIPKISCQFERGQMRSDGVKWDKIESYLAVELRLGAVGSENINEFNFSGWTKYFTNNINGT